MIDRAPVGELRVDWSDIALHEAGHISDQELKVSKDAYDIADVEYQSSLEQMRLAKEDGVSTDVEGDASQFLDIVAPASGTIIAIDIEEGEIVTSGAMSYSSGTTLMTIADHVSWAEGKGVIFGQQGELQGTAVLTGDKGTVLDLVYTVDSRTGHGSGVGKDNKGNEYKILF